MMIEQEPGPPAGRGATLVFDHCRARGLVCTACNNTLSREEHVPARTAAPSSPR